MEEEHPNVCEFSFCGKWKYTLIWAGSEGKSQHPEVTDSKKKKNSQNIFIFLHAIQKYEKNNLLGGLKLLTVGSSMSS